MTVSAATLGVALSAPVFGALTERLARKRVIVASLLGISIPTLLAATSTSLAQLIFWRFLQGIMVPGVVAVLVTYIGEEWPPDRVALIMSFYVSGTALGGFTGRVGTGILTDWFNWRIAFLRSAWHRSQEPPPWPPGCRTDAPGLCPLTRVPLLETWESISPQPIRSTSFRSFQVQSPLPQPPPDRHFCRWLQRPVSPWSGSSPGSPSISAPRRILSPQPPSARSSSSTSSASSSRPPRDS
jgi:hypothetical protein